MKNNIRYLRRSEEFDITQKELAQAVGVTTATIQRIEKGASTSTEITFKIADYFKRDPREIFFSENGAPVQQEKQTS